MGRPYKHQTFSPEQDLILKLFFNYREVENESGSSLPPTPWSKVRITYTLVVLCLTSNLSPPK